MSTQAQVQEQALVWVRQNWGADRKCHVCGHSDWGVGESLGIKPYPPVDVLNSRVYPLIPVICQNCGYAELLSGVVAGIFPRQS
jgi:predicted nucleic-acid-binding Zn-ribbon protein